jgi:Flp pilus assembly protein TadD
MQLFRQTTPGVWSDVFRRMAAELTTLVASDSDQALMQAFELHRQGQLDRAAAAYRAILASDPRQAQAWHLLGVAAHQQGRHAEAVAHIRQAIAIDSGQYTFHVNLATALTHLEQVDDAIAAQREAVRLKPEHPQLHNDLGILLANRMQLDEAAASFRRATELDANLAAAWNNLGNTLNQLQRPGEAIACFERAIRLEPAYVNPHNGLGASYATLERFDEALESYRQALARQPDYADAHNNIGQLLGQQGRVAEALAQFELACRLQPQNAWLHNNLGMYLLLSGRLAEGWPEYEWRWKVPGSRERPPGPLWNGEPLAGRTVLLHAEQGLGDSLQFVRYAPLVQARGGRVIVRCTRRLIPILSTCPGVERLVAEQDPLPAYDVHAALASLPGIFRTELASIPAQVPYLSAPAELVEAWSARLAPDGRLRVGINWQGNRDFPGDKRRSMALAEFAPLAKVAGVRLLSLQQGEGIEQLSGATFPVEDLAGHTWRARWACPCGLRWRWCPIGGGN